MDAKAIHGDVVKVLTDNFGLKRERCHAFVLDGCSAKMKTLDSLLMNFPNAVGVRRLLNSCGNELASEEIDRFAVHMQTFLFHSHTACAMWRELVKGSPPDPISHCWCSRFARNDLFVRNWQPVKPFVDRCTFTDEARSKAAQALRHEIGRVRPDGIHQELVWQLGFAIAVDVGITGLVQRTCWRETGFW